MVCKFRFCTYEKDYQCTLPEIAIDENGYCILSRHVSKEMYNPSPENKKKLEECMKQLAVYKDGVRKSGD